MSTEQPQVLLKAGGSVLRVGSVPTMKQVRDDVWLITGVPPYAINCYLVGDVLVDAMTRRDAKRILRALSGREVSAHALTHAHPDHQGATHAVCSTLRVPCWAPEMDAPAVENPALIGERQPRNLLAQTFVKAMAGPAQTVSRLLKEGDELTAGFVVLDTPGHSLGHASFWRESDRTLICGDVVNSQHALLGLPGLREPMAALTPDPATNRASIGRLGELAPELVLVGHGRPVRDPAKFAAFAAQASSK